VKKRSRSIKPEELKSRIRSFFNLLKATYSAWSDREPFDNSVIIAYYTIFSLPGLLVIIINLVGMLFGNEVVTHQVSSQISGMVGQDTAEDIESMIITVNSNDGTVLSTILSIATLLFGATGVFYHLQQVLNKIWEVKPKPKGKFLKLVTDRVFSFGLILVVGFLLLVSLVLSAALAAVSNWLSGYIDESLNLLFRILDLVLSTGIITLLFAAIFKFLPDAKIRWRDVWAGAFLTSILFVIVKFALGLYFGNTNPGSAYGAAGTVILIMLWVSYAGLIILFGAEFTRTYAIARDRRIEPTANAQTTDNDAKVKRVQTRNTSPHKSKTNRRGNK
jgi:membrane protein